MAGGFAAEHRVIRQQLLVHVAVADLGAHELDAEPAQRQLDRHVGHEGADRAGHAEPLRPSIGDQQVKQLVPVVEPAVAVHQLQAVGIAVQRDA